VDNGYVSKYGILMVSDYESPEIYDL